MDWFLYGNGVRHERVKVETDSIQEPWLIAVAPTLKYMWLT